MKTYKIFFDKLRIIILSFLIFFFLSSHLVFASSSYVLPYPSTMPGGINYKIHVAWEKVLQYWYYGDFGQFEYNLKESDKYLVEAKTLFEYQQYLLGFSALQKSNTYFVKILPFLEHAKNQGKDSTEKRQLLKEASQKHIEVLQKMEKETPAVVNWNPEKMQASQLDIKKRIDQSILLRKSYE